MKRTLLIAALLTLAFPATVGAAAKTYTVKTGDDFFSPTKKTIKVDDVVKWVWVGADGKPGETINEHTIVESKDRFHSDDKTSGTFKRRFKKAGKFTIFCAQHDDKMKIVITVKQ